MRMNQPLSILCTAAVTVLVSILEAISIAKALGEKHGYQINRGTELRGVSCLFCMNVLEGFFLVVIIYRSKVSHDISRSSPSMQSICCRQASTPYIEAHMGKCPTDCQAPKSS